MHKKHAEYLSPQALAKKLAEALQNVLQQKIAAETGVHQSQVSRILRGGFKRSTAPNVLKLCEYAKVNPVRHSTLKPIAKDKELMRALEELWSASQHQSRPLSELLRIMTRVIEQSLRRP